MQTTENVTSQSLREMTIEEVYLVPETRLQELYDVVHFYRIGRGNSSERMAGLIEEFSGSWAAVSEDEFDGFLSDVRGRRQTAFGSRCRP